MQDPCRYSAFVEALSRRTQQSAPHKIENVLDFDSLDQNLLDSTVSNAKSFALHLSRCKIPWISLATVGLVQAERSRFSVSMGTSPTALQPC
jgi:hypothetical protein